MEFPFNTNEILPGRISVIETVDSGLIIFDLDSKNDNISDCNTSWTYHPSANTPWDLKIKRRKEALVVIVDEIGLASSKAQNLRAPITSLKKLLSSSRQKMYVIKDVESRLIIGMLKIGIKRLFLFDELGAHHEVDPLCILDFYVHESKQRCGFGRELFDAMLQAENISPEKLAIDRPSLKCLAFLQKHYNLKDPVLQTNNFVIYPHFFHNRPVLERSNRNSKQKADSNKQNTDSLQTVRVPVSATELKKNKTFYSSAGNCLQWDDFHSNNGLPIKKHNLNSPSHKLSHYSDRSKDAHKWGVHDALHSYSASKKDLDYWNQTSHCSLTPVDGVPRCSPHKWNQLQSSWNILGVKPVNYALYQKDG
ncbi:alpha-tubulin N-acetyltransferase 1-like isoform X2 [Uloborus diversus]|uniref:alpha-tubulin N-acetyltransferase 1-like isoform X2 n=1 Tax=Uloborus diversus TaxID=327109 RepID=UPI0024097891|nr:alpha-tubulin N-acetyltransferase 1-like isoform X2 [Uloborus diversus]